MRSSIVLMVDDDSDGSGHGSAWYCSAVMRYRPGSVTLPSAQLRMLIMTRRTPFAGARSAMSLAASLRLNSECSALRNVDCFFVVERAQKLPNRVGVALVAVIGEGAQQFAKVRAQESTGLRPLHRRRDPRAGRHSPGRAGPIARASWLVGVSKMGG